MRAGEAVTRVRRLPEQQMRGRGIERGGCKEEAETRGFPWWRWEARVKEQDDRRRAKGWRGSGGLNRASVYLLAYERQNEDAALQRVPL